MCFVVVELGSFGIWMVIGCSSVIDGDVCVVVGCVVW